MSEVVPPRELAGYESCFGCAPQSLTGLRLALKEQAGKVSTEVSLGKSFESFPGVIHGGIVATILDEVMARTAYEQRGLPAMTAGMRVRYVQVMRSHHVHSARAEVISTDGNLVRIQAQLESAEHGLIAAADGTFFLWTPEQLASGKMGLPPETLASMTEYFKSNSKGNGDQS